MRLLVILIALTGSACGLPSDIVGPVDPGPAPAPLEDCPTPAPDSGVERRAC